MNSVIYSRLFFSVFFLSHIVFAEEEQTIHLGYHILNPDQKYLEPIFKQQHSIPIDCDGSCQLTWEVINENKLSYQATNEDSKYVSTGIDGLFYKIIFSTLSVVRDGPFNTTLEISLIQDRKIYINGRENLISPKLRWKIEYQNQASDYSIVEKTGMVNLDAEIGIGGCQISNTSLNFNLPTVSTHDLSKVKLGEPYLQGGDQQTMEIICSPGIANNVHASFTGFHGGANPHIILANDQMGFILVEGVNKSNVIWDGTTSSFTVPANGIMSIPLAAYYTRVSNNVSAGSVTAIGQFSVTYD